MTIRLLDSGECALVVEFGSALDDRLVAQVLALDAALRAAPPPGVVETVPTYRSLMVHYDPLVASRAQVAAAVQGALGAPAAATRPPRRHLVPACYAPDLAPDLDHVAQSCGLTPAQVIDLHRNAVFRVVMYGFAPGWAYLSGLPAALTLPRRATPRDLIPAGSLIIAGGQAIVAGGAMPSGWHIIGRTPLRSFDPARDPAFLFAPGDEIAFDPIPLDAFRRQTGP